MHTKFKIYHTEDSSFIGRSSIKERYFKFKVDLSKIELWKDEQSVVRYYLPDDLPGVPFSMSRFQKNEAKNGKYQFLSAVVDEPCRVRDFMMHWELDTVRHDFLNLLSQTATDSNLELDRYLANRLLTKMVEEAKEGPKESGYIIKMRADERLKGIAMEFELNHEPTTYNKILSLGKNPSLVNDIIIGYENEETEEAVILYENRENVIFSLVLRLLIDISMDMKEAHY